MTHIDRKYVATVFLMAMLYVLAGNGGLWLVVFTYIVPPIFGVTVIYVITLADKVYRPTVDWPHWVYLILMVIFGALGGLLWAFRTSPMGSVVLYGAVYGTTAYMTLLLKVFTPKTKGK